MLTSEQVDKIAMLSRLSLTPEEREKFTTQLSDVLAYVDALQKVDTENVEPMAHAVTMPAPLRDDVTAPSPDTVRTALLAQFPEREGDLLKVKGVFN